MRDHGLCQEANTTAFEEVAVALIDAYVVYPIPDEAIWCMANEIDVIHKRIYGRCFSRGNQAGVFPDDVKHPAIIHLLSRLKSRSASNVQAIGTDWGAQ